MAGSFQHDTDWILTLIVCTFGAFLEHRAFQENEAAYWPAAGTASLLAPKWDAGDHREQEVL